MSSDNAGKNIVNAFTVVYETYDSIQKLISFLLNEAMEKGEYATRSDKFLRWKSDQDIYGWALNSFILVFQRTSDTELESGWFDGPVYITEINLCDEEEPVVYIARFDYEDINKLPSVISPSHYWAFNHPLNNIGGFMDYTIDEESSNYEGHIVDETKKASYWGIEHIKGITVPLMDITAENASKIIFGGFDTLTG